MTKFCETCQAEILMHAPHEKYRMHARRFCSRLCANRAPKPRRGSLTPKDVQAIRASTLPNSELAERYGISRSHVSNIRAGRMWQAI